MSKQPLPQQPLPAPILNVDNIQGDIILGLPKKVEQYLFFEITDVAAFKKGLAQLVPLITTTNQVLHDRAKISESKHAARHGGHEPPILPIAGINISFSQVGIAKFNQPALVGTSFVGGQLKDSPNLGDPVDGNGSPTTWINEFKQNKIDVLVLASGDCWERVDANVKKIHNFFGKSVNQIFTIKGNVRPGKEKGHEHFGFLDGISQPAVEDFNAAAANPGQLSVPPGIILVGEREDKSGNPPWAQDGSFLAFRFLEQLVPEFDAFLDANPIPGHPHKEGSELLGARLVGRWKSGAPVDLSPKTDDPFLAKTANGNNNFDFNKFKPTNDDPSDDQLRCPFVAHIRKTNPRSDIPEAATTPHRIIRQGIPFGPEVTHSERRNKKTEHSRGLAFVSYQSSIDNGFHFLQQTWANNPGFVPNKQNVQPGIDAIIGQKGNAVRQAAGTDPKNPSGNIDLPVLWVIPKGGEYFFSPSISGLKTLAA